MVEVRTVEVRACFGRPLCLIISAHHDLMKSLCAALFVDAPKARRHALRARPWARGYPQNCRSLRPHYPFANLLRDRSTHIHPPRFAEGQQVTATCACGTKASGRPFMCEKGESPAPAPARAGYFLLGASGRRRSHGEGTARCCPLAILLEWTALRLRKSDA